MFCFGYDNLANDAKDGFKRLKRVLYLIGILCKNIDENGKINTKELKNEKITIKSITNKYDGNNFSTLELHPVSFNAYNELYKGIIGLFDIDRRYSTNISPTCLLFLQCMYIMNAEQCSYKAPMKCDADHEEALSKEQITEHLNFTDDNKVFAVPEYRIYHLDNGEHFFNAFKCDDGEYYVNGASNEEQTIKNKINKERVHSYNFEDRNFNINEKDVENKQRFVRDYRLAVDDNETEDLELVMKFNQKNDDEYKEKIFDLDRVFRYIKVDRRNFVDIETRPHIIKLIDSEIDNFKKKGIDIIKTYIDEERNVIVYITQDNKAVFTSYKEYYSYSTANKCITAKTIETIQKDFFFIPEDNKQYIMLKRYIMLKGGVKQVFEQIDGNGISDNPDYYTINNVNNKIEVFSGALGKETKLKTIYDGRYYHDDNKKIEKGTQAIDDPKVFNERKINNYISSYSNQQQQGEDNNINYNGNCNDNSLNNNNNNNELVTKYHITDIKKSNHLFETENNINYNNNNYNNYINNNSIHQNDNNNIIPHNNNNNDVLIFENENDNKTCCQQSIDCIVEAGQKMSAGFKNCFNACCYGLNACCDAIKRIFTR